jgi:hypothetical protein
MHLLLSATSWVSVSYDVGSTVVSKKYPLLQGILSGCVLMKMQGKSYKFCKDYFDSFAVQYYPLQTPQFPTRQVLWRLVKQKENENMKLAGYTLCEGCGK